MMTSSRHSTSDRCLVMALAPLLIALLLAAAAAPVYGASEDLFISDFKPARALLQSGTSCPTQIPGCMSRRCTTRTVDNVKDRYVCLRCKQGFVPVLSSNRKSIIQCSECIMMSASVHVDDIGRHASKLPWMEAHMHVCIIYSEALVLCK